MSATDDAIIMRACIISQDRPKKSFGRSGPYTALYRDFCIKRKFIRLNLQINMPYFNLPSPSE